MTHVPPHTHNTLNQGLPDDEKRYWHSHVYEVLSGQLVAPGVPLVAANRCLVGQGSVLMSPAPCCRLFPNPNP